MGIRWPKNERLHGIYHERVGTPLSSWMRKLLKVEFETEAKITAPLSFHRPPPLPLQSNSHFTATDPIVNAGKKNGRSFRPKREKVTTN